MQGIGIGQLKAFFHTPIDKVLVCLVVIALLFIVRVLWRQVERFFIYISTQPLRKRIFKAADGLEKQVTTALDEMTAYRDALRPFIAKYADDKTKLSPDLDKLKLATTRLALPKMNPARFQDLRHGASIHLNADLYYGVFYNAVMLSGFCNLYREFFAQDNWHHLEAVDTLVASLYHVSPLKAHAEYVAKKATEQEADYTVRYFTAYGGLIDQAIDYANALQNDVRDVKKYNTFIWWLAGGP